MLNFSSGKPGFNSVLKLANMGYKEAVSQEKRLFSYLKTHRGGLI
jgi:hypothetical protein